MVSEFEIFSHPGCLEHRVLPGMPELRERLERILDRVESGDWTLTEAGDHPGLDEAISRTHRADYIARFRRAVERGDGVLGSADNPLSPGTWDAARAAVGTALAAGDWVAAAAGRRAFAAVRPPGHHAEHALAMGFCYFNNVAVLADHLIAVHGLSKVAIFDFDVHHGNGTQHLFEDRADVLYASTHQYPFYPGTGAGGERGIGPGAGATLNVPLPEATGDDGYAVALEDQILPALESFAPEVLLLSAGFDAWKGDPLGGMRVSEAAFHRWGERLGEIADRCCDGKVVALLEGGYDLDALPRLVEAHLEGLRG